MNNYCDQPATSSAPSFPKYFEKLNNYGEEKQGNNCSSQNDKKSVKKEKRKYRCRIRSPEAVLRSKRVRRSKANARERKRMHSLNDALEELRRTLPHVPDEPKLTKIETLRMAYNYIYTLAQLLSSGGESEAGYEKCDAQFPTDFSFEEMELQYDYDINFTSRSQT